MVIFKYLFHRIKIFSFLVSLFLCPILFAQNEQIECGTSERMDAYFAEYPESRYEANRFNEELSKLVQKGNNNQNIYEIPVVVHIISDGSAIGTPYNRSDQQVIDWINYTNEVFAGTAPNILNDSNGGAVIPVKLVLAKVSPDCTATNGINRVNLSTNSQYVNFGVNGNQGFNGVYDKDITDLARWDPTKYYNIYVVNKLLIGTFVAAGYASFAGTIPMFDDCFVMGNIVNIGNGTMAHEFGHAMGLWHTQEGSNGNICPPNANCALDGDMVCDTEPMISLLSIPCTTGIINSCTGAIFNGTEQNIMAYTNCFRNRFTQGQKNRAVSHLLQYRNNLLNSPVLQTQPVVNNANLISGCIPTSRTGSPGDHHSGITMVSFGDILNYTETYNETNQEFYANYSADYCLGTGITKIALNNPTLLSVQVGYNIPHNVKVYIDYNNDGSFNENTELVLYQSSVPSAGISTINVTPPNSATLNTPLRMRVIGELDLPGININACYLPAFGQVEDYAVIIDPSLSLLDIDKEKTLVFKTDRNSILIQNPDNKIANVSLYDMSGKLIESYKKINQNEFETRPFFLKNNIAIVVVELINGKRFSKKILF